MSRVFSFERDPYLQVLEVQVRQVDRVDDCSVALLDDTVLYPEGGGQPADRGRLGAVAVVDVQRREGEVLHFLESSVEPGPHQLVLDWARRFDHMQQHTAQHLISRIALDRFGWATKSFHLGPESSDIELTTPPPSSTDLQGLEDAVCDLIAENRPVSCRRVTPQEYSELEVRSRGLPADHRGDVRLVEIEGVDLNTCGGTHVRATAELGVVKLLGAEPLRGGCRLYWLAGLRVRTRLAESNERSAGLRRLFDAGDHELLEVAGKRLEQMADLNRKVRRLENSVAASAARELLDQPESVVEAHLSDLGAGVLRTVARIFSEESAKGLALLTTTENEQTFFALAAGQNRGIDLKILGAQVADIFEGRGGCNRRVFQGKVRSLAKRDLAFSLIRAAVER
ncbi:MAG: hypothetical protein V3S30_01555 [Thermoanaerobaculia bacterium]